MYQVHHAHADNPFLHACVISGMPIKHVYTRSGSVRLGTIPALNLSNGAALLLAYPKQSLLNALTYLLQLPVRWLVRLPEHICCTGDSI